MGADQPVVQEAEIGQVLGGQAVAMRLHRRDLAPDLVAMDGGPGVELLLQRAQVLQQLGRAHVGRPGRGGDADAAVRLAVPLLVGVLDGPEMALAQRAVELEGRGIADRGADPVIGALAQQEAHAGAGQRLGVVVDVVGVLQHQRGAAAQRLERAEQRHGAALVGRHVGQRDGRQAAGEGRLVRRREILEHAARQGHGEMRVHVGEARHHHLARAVDLLGGGMARQDLGAGPDRGDAVAVDGDRRAVVQRVLVVDGGDHGVVDDDGHGFPRGMLPMAKDALVAVSAQAEQEAVARDVAADHDVLKSRSPVALGRSSKPICSSCPPGLTPDRTWSAPPGLRVAEEWKIWARVSGPRVVLVRVAAPLSTEAAWPVPGATKERVPCRSP